MGGERGFRETLSRARERLHKGCATRACERRMRERLGWEWIRSVAIIRSVEGDIAATPTRALNAHARRKSPWGNLGVD